MKLQNTTTALAILTIASALGLVGVVAITIVAIPQEAEAGCERGKAVNQSLAKSNGKCFDQGTF